MLRPILLFLTLLVECYCSALTPMPDAALRNWANGQFPGCIVGTNIDETHPGVIAATDLWLTTPGIQDLTGLSAFVNVTQLQIHGLNLGTVNELPPQLTDFTIMNSQFTSITDSPTLTYLGIRDNNLSTVELGYYPQLSSLSCADNQLTTLDVGSCPALGWLNCSHNQLTSITGYGAFVNTILASHNQLNSLSVPFYCSLLDISHNQFTTLPSMTTSVSRTVNAQHNQISTFSWAGGSQLSSVDISHNLISATPNLVGSALRALNVGNNPLTALGDLPVRLRDLWVDSTQLTCLPYLNRYLEELYTQGTAITCIPNQPPSLLMSATNFGFTPQLCAVGGPCYISPPSLAMKVFLQGPFDPDTYLMNDDLRVLGLLPTTEPYTASGYTYSGQGWSDVFDPAVFTVNGNDAIVDWVVVEMRPNPAVSLPGNAMLYSRPALLQRDGDVVGLDGSWPLMLKMNQGSYVAAIRHRNHLGAVEKFGTSYTDTTEVKDYTTWTAMVCWPGAMHGDSLTDPNRQLWCGDVNFDHVIRYTGADNDRDAILEVVGGTIPTNVMQNVYAAEDVNMDGSVKYVGVRNDRDLILQSIGGTVPTATRTQIGFQ